MADQKRIDQLEWLIHELMKKYDNSLHEHSKRMDTLANARRTDRTSLYHCQLKIRQLEKQLLKTNEKNEQSKQATANVTPGLGYRPGNQLTPVVQANKGPAVDQVTRMLGLSEILVGPLAFIKERLTAVNGVLCLDGGVIYNVPEFKRLIQIKPWVVFSGEYVIDCLHCGKALEIKGAREENSTVNHAGGHCNKSTPFLPASEGSRWTRCDHCSNIMKTKAELRPDFTGGTCFSCKGHFVPKIYDQSVIIRTPYRRPPPIAVDEKPSPSAEPAGLPR